MVLDPSTQHLIAGTIAGASSTIAMYPLELVKTRMQVTNNSVTAYRSLASTIRSIFTHEGVYGFYNGMTPAIIASSGSWGGYFYLYELSKRRKLHAMDVNGDEHPGSTGSKLKTIDHLLSGTEAGVAMVFVFNPIWVVRTRMALQGAESSSARKYKGVSDALRTIWREEGIRGMYKGLVPALLLTSHGSIQFAVYEAMKSWVASLHNSEVASSQAPGISMLLGAGSKIIASTVTYPYQVIKSRLQQRQFNPEPAINISSSSSYQASNLITSRGYHNTWDCIVSMYRYDGVRSFFRGIVPNLIKVTPGAAITFLVYEECMKLLKL